MGEGKKVFKKLKKDLVISETDLDMAIEFISRHPESYPNKKPAAWSRQTFINHLNLYLDESGKKVEPGLTLKVGSSLWGHIDFVGIDLAGYGLHEDKLQVYISCRQVPTDPDKLIPVNRG
jgi:hypothetical protein